jgi:hypothetical protein
MATSPPVDPRRLSQQLKLQTAANRYAFLRKAVDAKTVAKIVNS